MSSRGRGTSRGRGRGRGGRGRSPSQRSDRLEPKPGGLQKPEGNGRRDEAVMPAKRGAASVPPPVAVQPPGMARDVPPRHKTPQPLPQEGDIRPHVVPAPLDKTPQQSVPQEDRKPHVVPAPLDKTPQQPVQRPGTTAVQPQTPPDRNPPQMQLAVKKPQQAVSKFVYKPPPDRPGFGYQGRPIALKTNFFDVKFRDSFTIHHYDVTITPAKIPKILARKVFDAMEKKYGDTVLGGRRCGYDGSKNMYSVQYLRLKSEREELPVTLTIDDREKEFVVSLKYAAPIHVNLNHMAQIMKDPTSRQTMVQALDVVLRHLPSMRLTPVGRSLFPPQVNPPDLGAGLQVWTGYYQSLRPTMGWKLRLNLDISASTFYKEQPVIDFMCDVLQIRDSRVPPVFLKEPERRQFAKEIRGLRIQVTHLSYPRKYKVNDVTQCSARKQTFPLDDGKNETVENYFKQAHPNVKLCFPNLPCLHVGAKDRHVYIPLELCKIVPGQRCSKKLSDYQVAEMIKFTAKPCDVRKREVLKSVQAASFNSDPVLQDFGIQVSPEMTSVPGRVLAPPTVQYRRDAKVNPRKGEWDMRGSEFHKGVEIKVWATIVFADSRYCRQDKVEKFLHDLRAKSETMGMRFCDGPRELYYFRPRDSVHGVFTRITEQHKDLELIIAILDKKGPVSYNDIKHAGDISIGIATQCILVKNVLKSANSTLGNLCLKINAKLGGINNIILPSELPPIFRDPIIIFGADVTHPPPADATKPSIASVVASMNDTASRYKAVHRNQKHRQEIIGELDVMVRELLIAFYRETRVKPVRIIFYRDGVSEGQFKEVICEEIAAIQRACTNLEDGYEPKVTFLVVQKRHHTRFFPVDRRDEDGRGKNVPPGTTVDREITHPSEFDFYLCSHTSIQGTSRPCHYHVLWDDNNFTADELQKLSYQLCHLFFRCNRSVSYPAPAYYAHRDAAHARCLLLAQEHSKESATELSRSDQARAIEIHEDRKDTMYYV